MAKNEKTILWILGIAVVILVLAQFTNIGGGVFAIAGGGAGSSVSQTVKSTLQQFCDLPPYQDDCWFMQVAEIRPPTGETWLITSYICEGAQYPAAEVFSVSTSLVTWVPDEVWPSTADPGLDAGLRLFVDNNFYLRCAGDAGETETRITITGVRV